MRHPEPNTGRNIPESRVAGQIGPFGEGRSDRLANQRRSPWRTTADLSRTRSAEVQASAATPAISIAGPTPRRPSGTTPTSRSCRSAAISARPSSRRSTPSPRGAALLIVRSGPTAGARYLLDTDVTTVGRHPEADIFFDDVTVSRRHAEITRDGTTFELVDQRSLNGTYVNGERVDRATLQNGSEVRIGKFRLNFFVSPADLAQAADG